MISLLSYGTHLQPSKLDGRPHGCDKTTSLVQQSKCVELLSIKKLRLGLHRVYIGHPHISSLWKGSEQCNMLDSMQTL